MAIFSARPGFRFASTSIPRLDLHYWLLRAEACPGLQQVHLLRLPALLRPLEAPPMAQPNPRAQQAACAWRYPCTR
jgi:hypothetical protein